MVAVLLDIVYFSSLFKSIICGIRFLYWKHSRNDVTKKLTLFISMCLETWCRLNQINICSCQALVFPLQFSVDFNTCLFTNGAKAFRLLNPETIHHFMWNFRTWLMIVLCSYHANWIEWTFVSKYLLNKKATCYHKYC